MSALRHQFVAGVCPYSRYNSHMHKPDRIEPGPGQESVWDYPRPPEIQSCSAKIEIVFNDSPILTTTRSFRILETSHPPTFYLPYEDFAAGVLVSSLRRSFCEWKGQAAYFDIEVDSKRAFEAAWGYPNPVEGFAALKDHVAVYAHLMDACYVDGELVRAQQGDFYGGWITSNVVGPFKGPAGTQFW